MHRKRKKKKKRGKENVALISIQTLTLSLSLWAVVNKIREVLWFDSLIYVSCSIHICEISLVVL